MTMDNKDVTITKHPFHLCFAASETAGGSPADSALSGRQAMSMHTVKRTEIVLLCADFLFRFIFFSFL